MFGPMMQLECVDLTTQSGLSTQECNITRELNQC